MQLVSVFICLYVCPRMGSLPDDKQKFPSIRVYSFLSNQIIGFLPQPHSHSISTPLNKFKTSISFVLIFVHCSTSFITWLKKYCIMGKFFRCPLAWLIFQYCFMLAQRTICLPTPMLKPFPIPLCWFNYKMMAERRNWWKEVTELYILNYTYNIT